MVNIKGLILRDYRDEDFSMVFPMVEDLYTEPGDNPREAAVFLATVAEAKRNPQKLAVMVLEKEQKIIGYLILVFFWSHEFGGDILEIDELYIEPACRSKGYGQELLLALPGIFPAAKGFSLCSNQGNHRAQSLYQKAGFKPSPFIHLLKLLDNDLSRQAEA